MSIDARARNFVQAVHFSLKFPRRVSATWASGQQKTTMADENTTEPQETPPEAESATGLRGRIARVLRWARDSKLRMGLTGLALAVVCGSVFATWSYLAHLAVDDPDLKTIEMALVALDADRFEEAKSIVGQIQEQPNPQPEFGGALFVLGAAKAAQADQEWSLERQRAMHLIAARYLQKARDLGVPQGRESEAEFLVGRSLILGNEPAAGIAVLKHAVQDPTLPTTEIHTLLTDAYQSIPEPDLPAALSHNQAVLDDNSLNAPERDAAIVTHAQLLVELQQLEAAHETLAKVANVDQQQARITNVEGRIAVARAEQAPAESPQRTEYADQAIAHFREAQRLDPLSSELTRQAMYWIGWCYELKGDVATAAERYDQLSKSYGDTPESIAAMLAKADLARQADRPEQALIGYRAVLAAAGDPVTYVNRLLPISALRKRLRLAYDDFLNAGRFDSAMALVDALQPVFDLQGVTQLRARAHQKWALARQREADELPSWQTAALVKEARYHRRAAGVAYELLSQLRFASREFTDDLWQSADNFLLGQSYSHGERMLVQYLHHEAQDKQALALLRLGQAKHAQGKYDSAIETLSECIELHPGDAVVYQARLDCAAAHLQQNQGDKAEQLLLANLAGGSLEPTAAEWRDSLFVLGDYLHNSGRYPEAIEKLDEAVRRFPEAEQAIMARYTIARSYHNNAAIPARLAAEAKTDSERLKNRKLRDKNLEAALENYLLVQRLLTLRGHVDSNDLERLLLRNCYMMQGSVLYQVKRYDEARKAYANISTLYQSEPFVLESFVHIANCYRKLGKPIKAKGTLEQAKLILDRLPPETDFKLATNFSRQQWGLLLNEMSEW